MLVVAGELVQAAARRAGVNVFPIDSEHNAIYQAMHGHRRERREAHHPDRVGRPVPAHPRATSCARVTPAQALKHPTWKMGNKITIDSSTLMNKGLEVIEAHWLFGLPPDQIDVVIHPQSIVHSMVEYVDGSVLAQLGIPDMAIPISYILAYPERLPLDASAVARPGARRGGSSSSRPTSSASPAWPSPIGRCAPAARAPAVLNAANEVLVDAFLNGAIGYLDIPGIAAAVLDRHTRRRARRSLDDLLGGRRLGAADGALELRRGARCRVTARAHLRRAKSGVYRLLSRW